MTSCPERFKDKIWCGVPWGFLAAKPIDQCRDDLLCLHVINVAFRRETGFIRDTLVLGRRFGLLVAFNHNKA